MFNSIMEVKISVRLPNTSIMVDLDHSLVLYYI